MLFGHGKKKVSSNNVVWSWRKKKYHQTTLFGHGEKKSIIKQRCLAMAKILI